MVFLIIYWLFHTISDLCFKSGAIWGNVPFDLYTLSPVWHWVAVRCNFLDRARQAIRRWCRPRDWRARRRKLFIVKLCATILSKRGLGASTTTGKVRLIERWSLSKIELMNCPKDRPRKKVFFRIVIPIWAVVNYRTWAVTVLISVQKYYSNILIINNLYNYRRELSGFGIQIATIKIDWTEKEAVDRKNYTAKAGFH